MQYSKPLINGECRLELPALAMTFRIAINNKYSKKRWKTTKRWHRHHEST